MEVLCVIVFFIIVLKESIQKWYAKWRSKNHNPYTAYRKYMSNKKSNDIGG